MSEKSFRVPRWERLLVVAITAPLRGLHLALDGGGVDAETPEHRRQGVGEVGGRGA